MRQKLNRLKKPSEAWIYDQVFSAILDQRLMPDTKLTEKDLCDVFGVSRTIIRKVLLRLSIDVGRHFLRGGRRDVFAGQGPPSAQPHSLCTQVLLSQHTCGDIRIPLQKND